MLKKENTPIKQTEKALLQSSRDADGLSLKIVIMVCFQKVALLRRTIFRCPEFQVSAVSVQFSGFRDLQL